MTQIWTARTEQGFQCRQHGLKEHILLDFEGLHLMTKLRRKPKASTGPANSPDSATSKN